MCVARPIKKRLVKKAVKSNCRFNISAVAVDHKGDILGYSYNRSRFEKKGGGIHAEMALMAQYGKNIKTIIICRTNNNGDLLPIDPCDTCKVKAEELGIKIVSMLGGE